MTTIIPIASGKGGVGKTVVSANLGVALANLGKTVILVDLDLGGSNLHTLLGIRNRNPGIGEFVSAASSDSPLESYLVDGGVPRLHFIAGDGLLPGTANLPFFRKKRLLRELGSLIADFVIVDLGAGTAYNTVDLFLASNAGLLVTCPETTAVLNGYSFVKTALFRLLVRSFPAGSAERGVVQRMLSQRIEAMSDPIEEIATQLGAVSGDAEARFRDQLSVFAPRVILNCGRTREDLALGGKLREITRKNLKVPLEFVGLISYDDAVPLSIAHRKPAVLLYPRARFTQNVELIARRIVESPLPPSPHLFDSDEDLAELASQLPE